MSSNPPLSTFSARFPVWTEILDLIAAACDKGEIGVGLRLRIELAVEELFANTINHGYRGESDRRIWVAVRADGAGIYVDYQDEAPAFDPFSASMPASNTGIQERAIGGLGRLLVQNLASRWSYRHDAGRNQITLFFAREETP